MKMSTIFVGKWDRFVADLVIADKIDRIVLATRWTLIPYPKKTARLQIAMRVSTNATIKRYFEFKT
jgi:hypothetical protein